MRASPASGAHRHNNEGQCARHTTLHATTRHYTRRHYTTLHYTLNTPTLHTTRDPHQAPESRVRRVCCYKVTHF